MRPYEHAFHVFCHMVAPLAGKPVGTDRSLPSSCIVSGCQPTYSCHRGVEALHLIRRQRRAAVVRYCLRAAPPHEGFRIMKKSRRPLVTSLRSSSIGSITRIAFFSAKEQGTLREFRSRTPG